MIIEELILKNFRGYKDISISLNEKFNLIIGDNGSGKTAILEALTVAMGSLFLGFKGAESRSIHRKDIQKRTFEYSEEYGFPVSVEAKGIVNNDRIGWKRELTNLNSKTTSKAASSIKKIGQQYDTSIRSGELINLPVLAYYATGRLFDEARNSSVSKSSEIASRFRAYSQCLKAKMTFQRFIKWYKGKELSKIQKGESDIRYEIVKQSIISNIPDCENIYYELDTDKSEGLQVVLKDGRTLPFSYLSDGTRNFFALIADIAYKCVTLNPHLKENVLQDTTGIILIDELDLHLHPEWQRKIIHGLKETFPSIQFVATTHSPFMIQETEANQLIKLKNNAIDKIDSANKLSIEDIAEEFQEVENPQWSKKRQHMFDVAKEYYQAVKNETDTPELKAKFDNAMKPFALDTALYAMIEQEKIIIDYKKNQNKP